MWEVKGEGKTVSISECKSLTVEWTFIWQSHYILLQTSLQWFVTITITSSLPFNVVPHFKPLSWWWLILPMQNDAKKAEKCLKHWHMGTHLRVLSKSYSMNTDMIRYRRLSKILTSLCFERTWSLALKGLIEKLDVRGFKLILHFKSR